jgi:hypothetical protein
MVSQSAGGRCRPRTGRSLSRLRAPREKTRKDQASEFDLDTCVREARALGRKLIFYAGQQDYASGLVPRSLPESHVHSPYFADTVDALRHLAELAERNNWHIVFKPHPILANRSKNFKTAHPGRVDVALGANLFDCMEQCDVTTTIVSQVSYMALIHDRPCVLLGRTQLTGKGCVYEPHDFADIETVFQRALAEGFTEAQRTAWRRHVAQVMRHYAFGFEDDAAELLGRGVDDAARYLAELAAGDAPKRPSSLWNGDLRPTARRFKLRAAYRTLRIAEPVLRALSAVLPGDLKAALKKRYR